MESKYNLLTRLLKNIKNVVNPDGSIAGSGSGVLVVHETVTEEDGQEVHTLDKTWQEIHDADFAVLKLPGDGDSVRFAISSLVEEVVEEHKNRIEAIHEAYEEAEEPLYTSVFVGVGGKIVPYFFATDSPDGYPVSIVLPDGPEPSTPKE